MTPRRLNKRQLQMLRWGVPCCAGTILLSAVALLGNTRKDPAAPAADGTIPGLTNILDRKASEAEVGVRFENATESAGLHFRHFPDRRRSLLPEDMGSGLAWGDYDDDGDSDLFLVNFQGTILATPGKAAPAGCCALYRNDGDGTFTDVSEASRLGVSLFGMGAAWADYDDDGDLDLYITAYGPDHLFQNKGDGTFTEVTATAGVSDDSFSSGAAWADHDGDGDLDLYVCNYVDFQLREQDRAGGDQTPGSTTPYTINPSSYPGVPNRLYRNNGDGTFTDVAQAAGVADPLGRSLSAVWFDFDGDHRLDLYVANDVSANGVFRNRGDGTFEDIGAESLAADYRGAMGLATTDFDHDGDHDLFVTHWLAQENAFFVNMITEFQGSGPDTAKSARVTFMDMADSLGLGQVSLSVVSWATSFVDLDNDGDSDLWVVNGNTLQKARTPQELDPQRPFVFLQRPPEGFYEVARQACPDLARPVVGRGGAEADYDGDGRVDLAIAVHGGAPLLLRNTTPAPGHWVRVRLRQHGRNTRALGALVTVRSGDLVQTAQVGADGSYLSQRPSDPHFGLGKAIVADEIRVRWPDGTEDTALGVTADRVVPFEHTPRPGVAVTRR